MQIHVTKYKGQLLYNASQRRDQLGTFLVSAGSLISRISLGKRIFQQNHVSPRGPRGVRFVQKRPNISWNDTFQLPLLRLPPVSHSVSVSVFVSVSLSLCLCRCVSVTVSLCLSVSLSLSLCLYVSLSLCLRRCVCVSVSVSLSLYLCLCVSVSVSLSLCLYLCISILPSCCPLSCGLKGHRYLHESLIVDIAGYSRDSATHVYITSPYSCPLHILSFSLVLTLPLLLSYSYTTSPYYCLLHKLSFLLSHS